MRVVTTRWDGAWLPGPADYSQCPLPGVHKATILHAHIVHIV